MVVDVEDEKQSAKRSIGGCNPQTESLQQIQGATFVVQKSAGIAKIL